jgi:hypothetical protein
LIFEYEEEADKKSDTLIVELAAEAVSSVDKIISYI